uniref:Uncharacterized protein n=1 Tax=Anopheles atroparvus TaxID=41427 RepID=A0A182IZU6_ANOAO
MNWLVRDKRDENNMEIMKPSGHHHDHEHQQALHALHHGYDDHQGSMDCGELVGDQTGVPALGGPASDSNNNHHHHHQSRRSDSNNNNQHGVNRGGMAHAPPGTPTSANATATGPNGHDCDDDLSKSQLILIDDERSSLQGDDDRPLEAPDLNRGQALRLLTPLVNVDLPIEIDRYSDRLRIDPIPPSRLHFGIAGEQRESQQSKKKKR